MTPFGGNQVQLGTIVSLDNAPVDGVTAAFMGGIFKLTPGGVTAVIDDKRETVYVARMILEITPEDIRRENFAFGSKDGPSREMRGMNQQERVAFYQAWTMEFLQDMEVVWSFNPDAN
jgi:hypothetical protein